MEMARLTDRMAQIRGYQHVAQLCMNLTVAFMKENHPRVCLILIDKALDAMLKAFYLMQNNASYPLQSLCTKDVFDIISNDPELDQDIAIFISSVRFMASNAELSFFQKIQKSQLFQITAKADQLLELFSSRYMHGVEEKYCSVL